MEAQAILETLSQRGAVLTIVGERLNVAPRSVLDEELRGAIKASKRELLALLQEPAQVLAPSPAVPEPCAHEPPEPAPTSPAWRTPATWRPEHGLWVRCGGIVVTDATRANWRAYLLQKKSAATLAADEVND